MAKRRWIVSVNDVDQPEVYKTRKAASERALAIIVAERGGLQSFCTDEIDSEVTLGIWTGKDGSKVRVGPEIVDCMDIDLCCF